MKQLMKLAICLAILPLLFQSCSKDETAYIEYYITATPSNTIEQLDISFAHTRAYQLQDQEGTFAIRTVYLDNKELSLSTDGTQEPILLGASEIEASTITGYDFTFYDPSVTINSEQFELQSKFASESNKSDTEFQITNGEIKKIIFEIDTDASVQNLGNGNYKLLTKVNIIEE